MLVKKLHPTNYTKDPKTKKDKITMESLRSPPDHLLGRKMY